MANMIWKASAPKCIPTAPFKTKPFAGICRQSSLLTADKHVGTAALGIADRNSASRSSLRRAAWKTGPSGPRTATDKGPGPQPTPTTSHSSHAFGDVPPPPPGCYCHLEAPVRTGANRGLTFMAKSKLRILYGEGPEESILQE